MSRRLGVLPVVLTLALGLSACEKVGVPVQKVVAPPKPLSSADAIPLEYGDLVAVIPAADPGWAQLYFQKADKSIAVLLVNGSQGYLGAAAVEFPRR